MLQQTTVAAVVPYLERFLGAFPDIATLAAADQQDVLKLWEGLGYYSRARNLHAAARSLCANWSGAFPASTQEIQSLPGIGRYTAGAIASFAFNQQAPIVEANTVRLFSRLLAMTDIPSTASAQKRLWAFAEQIVPPTRPGEFNQALMDLGATVCIPIEPNCPSCPVRSLCKAFEANLVEAIPAKKEKNPPTQLYEASVAIHRNGRFLLKQRTADEWWTGLWDFPRIRLDDAAKELSPDPELFSDCNNLFSQIALGVRDQTGLNTRVKSPVQVINHAVTRYRIRLTCHVTEAVEGRVAAGSGYSWHTRNELGELPLTKTARKFASTLISR